MEINRIRPFLLLLRDILFFLEFGLELSTDDYRLANRQGQPSDFTSLTGSLDSV